MPEAKVKNEERLEIFRNSAVRRRLGQDFGKYETTLLIVTQMGYIPIAASMLLTSFSHPSKEFCVAYNATGRIPEHQEFFSLNMEFGKFCNSSATGTTTFLSSSLMWGAFIGSFICGFLSDFFGRKIIVIGSLAVISFTNFILCFASSLSWFAVVVCLLTLGFASGGYMVTNFVLLTEALELPKSRLLAASCNGWSLSMITTAFIGWNSKHWFEYHATVAVIAVTVAIIMFFTAFESCRWLSAAGKYNEAKKTALEILKKNGGKYELSEYCDSEWFDILGFTQTVHVNKPNKWKVLITTPQLLKTTIVMFYCFLASSIVSFGFYFSVDTLPGNRFSNLAFMGLLKFIMGFLPFIFSGCFTKRSIVILSLLVCCASAIIVIPIQYSENVDIRFMISVLSLVITAFMDPAWKINHLYSAELFPTSVRSIGRGVCNAGGRLGSVFAPMVTYFRTISFIIPNSVFCGLLIIQLIIVIICLPNDDDKNANEMDEE